MNSEIFNKMKINEGTKGLVLNPPDDYPQNESIFNLDKNYKKHDFIHLFIENRKQFIKEFPKTSKKLSENGLFWVSYPKSTSKIKPDINRDSMWDLCISFGFHPVAQVSLSETWSAVRIKINEEGIEYSRPNKIR